MTGWAVAAAISTLVLLPLLLNEAGELAPWMARKTLNWSARRLPTDRSRERYAEEWAANLEFVPGKLTKLMWALGILLWATPRLQWRLRRTRRVDGLVHRPEVDEVVSLLLGGSGQRRSPVTAVIGTGGFGKTAIARMVQADLKIRRQFRGGVIWVSGQSADPAEMVREAIYAIDPSYRHRQIGPGQGPELLKQMSRQGRRRLIILDDVHNSEQAQVFLPLTDRWGLMMTSRSDPALPGVLYLRVGDLTPQAAYEILTAGLRDFPVGLAEQLIAEAGRWPLILRILNRSIAQRCVGGTSVSAAAEECLLGLRRGADGERTRAELVHAVEASVKASVALLDTAPTKFFFDLSAFGPGPIPMSWAFQLWDRIDDTEVLESRCLKVIADLAAMGLVTIMDEGDSGAALLIHDLIHEYMARQLDPARSAQLRESIREG